MLCHEDVNGPVVGIVLRELVRRVLVIARKGVLIFESIVRRLDMKETRMIFLRR